MNEKRKGTEKFLGIYLMIVFGFGLLGLADSLLSLFGFSSAVYGVIVLILGVLFFFFNIFSLVQFMQERMEKITWVLPVYHMISYVLFFGLGVVLAVMGALVNWVFILLAVVGMLTSGFEILFSLYLLRRFEFF